MREIIEPLLLMGWKRAEGQSGSLNITVRKEFCMLKIVLTVLLCVLIVVLEYVCTGSVEATIHKMA